MRVVEPSKMKPVTKAKKSRLSSILAVILITTGAVVIFILLRQGNETTLSSVMDGRDSSESLSIENTTNTSESVSILTGDEKYQSLWYSLTIPGTSTPDVAPDIDSDTEFTRLVTSLAESRGYRLQKVYTGDNLVWFKGIQLEASVAESLQSLLDDAQDNGLQLSVSSGFRSIEEQEQIFMSRYNQQRSSGKSSVDAIGAVLEGAAPPAYSKHHSAYTIDMTCSGLGAANFIGTICDEWLSANDYAKAKQYGFIPSYPKNIDIQGPLPEPWEYNYVGATVVDNTNL